MHAKWTAHTNVLRFILLLIFGVKYKSKSSPRDSIKLVLFEYVWIYLWLWSSWTALKTYWTLMWYTVYVVWYTLFVVWYTLCVVWCALYVVWYTVYVVWYTLFVVWYTLYVVWYTMYRVSPEECARLRESVPYVKVYRYNPKHLYPNLNYYGDNGQRIVRFSCCSTYWTCSAVALGTWGST